MRFKIIVTVWCSWQISATIYPLNLRDVYIDIKDYLPPEDQVSFHLYESGDLSVSDELLVDDPESIKQSRYNPQLPTTLIVHGWTHGRDIPWLVEMREAMARREQWNIILVDWAPLAHCTYIEARVHNYVVGRQLSKFLVFLWRQMGMPMGSVHLIGHSMGAQIAAFAGHQVQKEVNETVGRISGLDPAAPLFEWPHVESLDDILDPGDANFVDVIHTNGRHLGVIFPSGHVDYYPNGGEQQPGCAFWVCSHIRACEFWTASVLNPSLFKAYSFKSWDTYISGSREGLVPVPMGIAASPRIPIGSYFLETINEERAYVNTTTTIWDSFNRPVRSYQRNH